MANTLLYAPAMSAESGTSDAASLAVDEGDAVHVGLTFPDGSTKTAEWQLFMPRQYAGGTVTFRLFWSGQLTTTNDVVWQLQTHRLQDNGEALDDTFDGTSTTATDDANTVSLAIRYTDITRTQAQMNSLAAGDFFKLRIQRLGSDAADTMTDDAWLFGVEISE